MLRRTSTPLEAIAMFAAVLVVAAVLFPIFARSRGSTRFSCQSNLKQIVLRIGAYVGDYDGKFPLVAIPYDASMPSRAYGWADGTGNYTRSPAIFHCYTATNRPYSNDPKIAGYTDYWFNRNLNGIGANSLLDKSNTLALARATTAPMARMRAMLATPCRRTG